MNHENTVISKIDDIENISGEQITQLRETGISYIKVPEWLTAALVEVETAGEAYFTQPKSIKEQHLFKPENREGYLDQSKNDYKIERFINRGSALTAMGSPLANCNEAISAIREHLKEEIILPLLKAIFLNLSIDNKFYSMISNDPDYTLSLIHYPPSDQSELRLQSHKDTILITVLWSQKLGYEANLNDKWKPLEVMPGYVIAQLGQGLELMTDKQCHAIEHRVIVPNKTPRLSIAMFLGPNNEIPLINFKTGEILNPRFGDYVKQHVEATYDSSKLK